MLVQRLLCNHAGQGNITSGSSGKFCRSTSFILRTLLHENQNPLSRITGCGIFVSRRLLSLSSSSTSPNPATKPKSESHHHKIEPETETPVSSVPLEHKIKNRSRVPTLTHEQLQWIPIYRFKHIVMARTIQRAKIGQTLLTCCVILPYSFKVAYFDPTSTAPYLGIGLSVLACVMLYIMGTMSSRIIGALYVHKDPKRQNILQLSTLSFLGKRVDTIIARDSFTHVCDLADDPADAYIKLQYADRDDEDKRPKVYLSLRFGTVLDLEAFQSVFGDVSKFMSVVKTAKNETK